MAVKRLCFGSAFVAWAMGFAWGIHGESIVGGFFLLVGLILMQVGAYAELSMKVRQIESYLKQETERRTAL
jgi:hypothetical protein